MSDKTGIEWTQATWNPTVGCRRVSEGCRNCYAEPQARRIVAMQRGLGKVSPYDEVVRMDATSGAPLPLWNGHAKAVADRLDQPLRWSKPRLIFVNSMSDLFHEDISFEFIASVFGVMAAAPQHTFQVLTKRPKRALVFFDWLRSQRDDEVATLVYCAEPYVADGEGSRSWSKLNAAWVKAPWPLPNVWLGVSVEDQATADERIPLLLECPAAVRWVSAEPLLGTVDFRHIFRPNEGFGASGSDALVGETWWYGDEATASADHRPENLSESIQSVPGPDWVFEWLDQKPLDWVVVGGESGPGARPFDITWARSIIAQCAAAGVPCFVKQLGAVPYETHPLDDSVSQVNVMGLTARKGGDMDEWPEDLRVRQWPGANT